LRRNPTHVIVRDGETGKPVGGEEELETFK
jgi:hypothetical protein